MMDRGHENHQEERDSKELSQLRVEEQWNAEHRVSENGDRHSADYWEDDRDHNEVPRAGGCRQEQRRRLAEWLESREIQIIQVWLIGADILLLLLEILFGYLKTKHFAEHEENGIANDVYQFLDYVSYCLTLVFLADIVALLYALGGKFFLHGGYVFDMVIMSVATVLEWPFGGEEEEFADGMTLVLSTLSLMRLWRVVRLGYAVHEAHQIKEGMLEKYIHVLRKALEDNGVPVPRDRAKKKRKHKVGRKERGEEAKEGQREFSQRREE